MLFLIEIKKIKYSMLNNHNLYKEIVHKNAIRFDESRKLATLSIIH